MLLTVMSLLAVVCSGDEVGEANAQTTGAQTKTQNIAETPATMDKVNITTKQYQRHPVIARSHCRQESLDQPDDKGQRSVLHTQWPESGRTDLSIFRIR